MTTYPAIFDDPRSPARRAAIMMYLLGVLGFFGGLCITLFGLILRDILTQPQFAMVFRHAHLPLKELRIDILAAGAICCLGGLALALLGFFVRKGATAPIIAGIALTIFALLVTGLIFVGSLLVTQSQKDMTIASVVWMLAIPVLMLIVLLIWLAAALRNAPYVRSLQTQRD